MEESPQEQVTATHSVGIVLDFDSLHVAKGITVGATLGRNMLACADCDRCPFAERVIPAGAVGAVGAANGHRLSLSSACIHKLFGVRLPGTTELLSAEAANLCIFRSRTCTLPRGEWRLALQNVGFDNAFTERRLEDSEDSLLAQKCRFVVVPRVVQSADVRII